MEMNWCQISMSDREHEAMVQACLPLVLLCLYSLLSVICLSCDLVVFVCIVCLIHDSRQITEE